MPDAMRLGFRFEDEQIFLESAHLLDKRTPPGDKNLNSKIADKGLGNWIELRDAKDRVLYRRRSSTPFIPRQVEVRTGNSKQPMKRIAGKFDRGVFSLLVPYVDGARTLLLIERLQPGGGKKVETVTRFDIKLDDIKFANGKGRSGR